ncbi:hypothetical protein [Halopenitus persicus]|uniref:hypothetical protein n=1 Tax=Halopenitus persicus TaxID=1048396 RepID=UPI0012FD51DE|nr:hypothetical protein [Halopenitus persicus]
MKDGSQIASYSPTQNTGTLTDAFLIDETGSTYEVNLQATDLKGLTGSSSTSQTVTNTAPVGEISSTPSTWYFGDSIDLTYDITDNEGDIQTREIRVFEAGTQIHTYPLSNNSGTISDAFTVDEKEVSYNAQLFLEDSDAQTDSESISQTITDNFGTLSLTSPENQTYFSYENSVDLSHTDSDRVPGESISCDLKKDGSVYKQRSFSEGSSISDSVSADLGNHSFTVSCSDDAANSKSKTKKFTVQNFEISNVSGTSQIYETEEGSYHIDLTAGNMVQNFTASLFWNGEKKSSQTFSNSAVTSYSENILFRPPLQQNNASEYNWNIQVEAVYQDFNASTTSGEQKNSSTENQTVWQAYHSPNITVSRDRVIEKEDFQADLSFTNELSEEAADIDGYLSFNGTENQSRSTKFDYPLVGDAAKSSTKTVTGRINLSFRNESLSREAVSNDSLTGHKKILTDCTNQVNGVTGEKALTFYLKNEEDRTQNLTGNIDYNFDTTHHGEHTRNYGFNNSGVKSSKICMYPSWAEYSITGPLQYSSSQDQNSLGQTFKDRQYNFNNYSINNVSESIDLYLLSQDFATPVYFQVEDTDGTPVEDATVKVLRYFISSNSYLTVAKSATDSNGVGTTYMRINEIYYKYVISKNGKTLLETDRQIFACQTSPCTKTFRINPNVQSPYFETEQGFSHSCRVTQNDDGNVTGYQCTVDHESEAIGQANLFVEKRQAIGYKKICDVTVSSASSSMICEFDETAAGNVYNYKLTAEKDGETFILDTGTLDYSKGLFEENAEVVALTLFLTLSMLGLISPSVSIFFSTLGMLVAAWLGLVTVGVSALGSIIVVAVIVALSGRS